jgi:hypothetical protein
MRKLGSASGLMDSMTSLLRTRSLRIAAMAVGAVAVAGAAVAITASAAGMSFGLRPAGSAHQASADTAAVDARASSTVCSDFMKHFAVEIGKTQAQINTAFQKSIADTLADEVKSGQITQAQADAIKKKLANQTPCTLPSTAGRTGGENAKPAIAAYMQQYLAASASALGITETQLKADLAAGQSLSQVAAAQHVSEADFRSRLSANLKPILDGAVSKKTITAAQEQTILNQLNTGPLPLWNAPVRKPKPTTTAPPATT